MKQYIAIKETYYNFNLYKRGEVISAPDTFSNVNFKPLDLSNDNSNQEDKENPAQLPEEVIRAKARELGIPNWHNKKLENLTVEINEIEKSQLIVNADEHKPSV